MSNPVYGIINLKRGHMTITIDERAREYLRDKEKVITVFTNKGCG